MYCIFAVFIFALLYIPELCIPSFRKRATLPGGSVIRVQQARHLLIARASDQYSGSFYLPLLTEVIHAASNELEQSAVALMHLSARRARRGQLLHHWKHSRIFGPASTQKSQWKFPEDCARI